MKTHILMLAFLTTLFTFGASAQKLDQKILAKADAFVYSSGNYTLAPEYQKTTRIIVQTDSVILKVTGDNRTMRNAFPITKERFEQFKQEIASCGIKKLKKARENLATGGSSHFFGIYDVNDECIFGASGYFGGGQRGGTLDFKANPEALFRVILSECMK